MKAEVCDFEHEATVDDTVSALQVAVAFDFTAVYVRHSLRQKYRIMLMRKYMIVHPVSDSF